MKLLNGTLASESSSCYMAPSLCELFSAGLAVTSPLDVDQVKHHNFSQECYCIIVGYSNRLLSEFHSASFYANQNQGVVILSFFLTLSISPELSYNFSSFNGSSFLLPRSPPFSFAAVEFPKCMIMGGRHI